MMDDYHHKWDRGILSYLSQIIILLKYNGFALKLTKKITKQLDKIKDNHT